MAELDGAGEEVGVQMGVTRVRDSQAATLRRRTQGTQVAARVHGQGAAVAQVEKVGAIAKPLVHERDQVVVDEAHAA